MNSSPPGTKRFINEVPNREIQREKMGIGFLNNFDDQFVNRILQYEKYKLAEKLNLEQIE